jgi:hypothetical protein
MKNLTGKSKAESAYGQDIPADKQEFTYEYSEFESPEEASNAGYNFMKLANEKERLNKKASAYQKHIEAYKPDPNSPEEVQKRLVSTLKAMGKSADEIKVILSSL